MSKNLGLSVMLGVAAGIAVLLLVDFIRKGVNPEITVNGQTYPDKSAVYAKIAELDDKPLVYDWRMVLVYQDGRVVTEGFTNFRECNLTMTMLIIEFIENYSVSVVGKCMNMMDLMPTIKDQSRMQMEGVLGSVKDTNAQIDHMLNSVENSLGIANEVKELLEQQIEKTDR